MYTLIFSITGDTLALSLHNSLFSKGERNLRLVTDRELAFSEWLHEAGSDGHFFTRIRLPDGFIIEPHIIKNLVNRIPYFQMPHFVNVADRQYAEMEMYALYTSFLYSVKERVIDGMPVRHINAQDNTLYFQLMAAKAGLDTLDTQFTSSPRWQQAKQWAAMAPQKKQNALWHKKSPHLVWENKPVLYNEPFEGLVKAEVVAGDYFCKVDPGKPFAKKIKAFSQLTGRTVYTLMLAEVKGKYKFYTVDTRPQALSNAALDAFCALLMEKK